MTPEVGGNPHPFAFDPETATNAELLTEIDYLQTINQSQAETIIALTEERDTARQERDTALLASEKDSLTELDNQKVWRLRLEDEIKNSQADGSHVAICFFDLDSFGLVNELLGHNEGDKLIQAYANKLASLQALLGSDISITRTRLNPRPGRLGGDEFGVFVNVNNEAEYRAFIALIHAMNKIFLEAKPILGIKGTVPNFGISVGFASTLEGPQSASELTHFADEDMYRAKRGLGHSGFKKI